MIAFQHALDDFQTVAHRLASGRIARARHDLELLRDLAVFDQFHARTGLLDDRARIAAHERVAPDVHPALDRLEEERLALAANFFIRGERRFKVREQAARDRNQVALFRQF